MIYNRQLLITLVRWIAVGWRGTVACWNPPLLGILYEYMWSSSNRLTSKVKITGSVTCWRRHTEDRREYNKIFLPNDLYTHPYSFPKTLNDVKLKPLKSFYLWIIFILIMNNYYNLRCNGFPEITNLISSRSSVSYFNNASANLLCSTECAFKILYALSWDSYSFV